MSLNIRLLRPEEHALLEETPAAGTPDPQTSVVVGAFNDAGELVGHLALVLLPHIEAAWIREDARGARVLSRLEREICETARKFGIRRLFAFAANETMADYITRLGYRPSKLRVFEKENDNVLPVQD